MLPEPRAISPPFLPYGREICKYEIGPKLNLWNDLLLCTHKSFKRQQLFCILLLDVLGSSKRNFSLISAFVSDLEAKQNRRQISGIPISLIFGFRMGTKTATFWHDNGVSETFDENCLSRRRIWGSREKIRFEIGWVVLPQIKIKAKFRGFGGPMYKEAYLWT